MNCPQCGKELTQVGAFQVCPEHGPVAPQTGATATGEVAKVRLFLSYGRLDAAELAARLAADLEREGFDVCMDRRTLRAGRDWQAQIMDGLRSTQIVIALLSPHAVRVSADPANPDAQDSVCLDEISFARFNQKPIVPVMAAPCEPPLCIYRLDYVDLVAWSHSEDQYRIGFQRLLDAIADARQGNIRYRTFLDCTFEPWDFAGFLYSKRFCFTGREWLFQELAEWLTQGREPALLITGDPGAGKSAIVAELVHRNPGGRLLAYHCCQVDTAATLQPDVFVRSLAAMLASQLPAYGRQLEKPAIQEILSAGKCAEDPGSAFEAGILNPLQTLHAPPPGVCYFLIDALDEALVKTGTGLTIVQLLASRLYRLPPWLRLVATSRKDPQVLDRLRGLRARELNAQDPRNLADLQGYLELRLAQPELVGRLADRGLTRDAVVRTILDKSEGNFLYVREVLDGLHKPLDQGGYSFDELDNLPPGLYGIYLSFFERAFPDETAFAPARRLLQVMVAAREPLTADQLAQYTGLGPEEELPRLLRRLSSYLPAREGKYVFFHRSLADWFTHEDQKGYQYYVSRRRGQEVLAAQGWQEYAAGPERVSPYMLAHLPVHLKEAGREEELRELLLDYAWLRAKLVAKGVQALIIDYVLLSGDRDLQLIQGALRLSAHVLARDPEHLAPQLLGRLLCFESSVLQDFCRRTVEMKNQEGRPWLRPLKAGLEAPGGALLRILTGHSSIVTAVALKPDGYTAVSTSYDKTLKVWDLETGQEVKTLNGHTEAVLAVALGPDSRTAISASYDKILKVWDLETGREVKTLTGHTEAVLAVALGLDGRTAVSASNDKTLKVWDLETGRELKTLTGHTGRVDAVALTPDGRTAVSASHDKTLKVWDLETGQEVKTLNGHTEAVLAVALGPDGRTAVSASHDKTLKVWDLETRAALATLSGHTNRVWAVAVSPDGHRAVSGATDDTLKVWDMETGQELKTLTGHTGWVSAVALSPEGRTAISASWDRTLKVWDLETGWEVKTLTGHTGWVEAVALGPDGRTAVSASNDKTLKVWNLETGRERHTLTGHTGWVSAMALSPDGRTAISSSWDKTLKVWDLETGRERHTLTGHTSWVSAVALSPEGRTAISASWDRTLKVWDLETGRESRTLTGGKAGGSQLLVLTADGRIAVSDSDDQTLKVWDLETGQEPKTLTGHNGGVTAVALTPDGRTAVSASYDNILKVWDLASGACLATGRGDGPLSTCSLGPDGRTIVAGDYVGLLHFLRLEGITPGLFVITAWRTLKTEAAAWLTGKKYSLVLGCPFCRRWSEIPENALGTEIPCPQCGKPLKVNPFVIEADWRPVARAWEKGREEGKGNRD